MHKATSKNLSVPIVYKALDTGDVDIFLGNWMPSMESIANKFFEKGTVVKYVANMPGQNTPSLPQPMLLTQV